MANKFIPDLIDDIDCILGIREEIGAQLKDVCILSRQWSGERIGDGRAFDTEVELSPSPYIVDLSHDIRGSEAGFIKQGDLLIKQISKNKFPTEDCIDGTVKNDTQEIFYKVGDFLYTVISVKERHLTWDIQVRRHGPQGDPND